MRYPTISLPYYVFGLVQKELAPEQVVMMASPEKALLDKVVTTVGLTLLGRVAASRYLLENLRLDEDSLRELDVAQMEE